MSDLKTFTAVESHQKAEDEDTTKSAVDDFTSWLTGLYDASLTTSFEIGSLAFFRSSYHHATMLGLSKNGDDVEMEVDAGNFSPIENTPVRTVSASMFVPKQSVINFRKEIRRRTNVPRPTSMPRLRSDRGGPRTKPQGTAKSHDIYIQRSEGLARVMKDQFALWETISKDFCRQGMGPALMSGNTVIDERNFAML